MFELSILYEKNEFHEIFKIMFHLERKGIFYDC